MANSDKHTNNDSDIFNFVLPEVTERTEGFIADENFEFDNEPVTEFTENEKYNTKDEGKKEKEYPEAPEQYRGVKSRSGEKYDPALHRFPPKETRVTGNWSKKSKKEREQEQSTGGEKPTNAVYQKAAQTSAHLYGALHKIPFGEGGKVKNENDLNDLTGALTRYYEQNGLKELDPKAEVFFQAAAYSFMVAMREENQTRTQWFIGQVKHYSLMSWSWLTGKKWKPKAKVVSIKKEPEKDDNQFAGDSYENANLTDTDTPEGELH